MLNTNRQQITGFQNLCLAIHILIAHAHIRWAIHLIVDARYRQAPFLVDLHTTERLDHRIHKHLQRFLVFRHINHNHALMHIDLGCSQPNPGCLVHGLGHILDQLA